MKDIEIQITARRYEKKNLSSEDCLLVEAACQATRQAYAPYSAFKVGAAVLLANAEVVIGNNQENVAYPSGLCAERVALFYANARYPDVAVKAIAVAAFRNDEYVDFVSPCGACRQVMAEVETRFRQPVRVLLCGRQYVTVLDRATDLLPFCFNSL